MLSSSYSWDATAIFGDAQQFDRNGFNELVMNPHSVDRLLKILSLLSIVVRDVLVRTACACVSSGGKRR